MFKNNEDLFWPVSLITRKTNSKLIIGVGSEGKTFTYLMLNNAKKFETAATLLQGVGVTTIRDS